MSFTIYTNLNICRYYCITNKTMNHLLKNALTDPKSLEYISDRTVMLGNIPSETNGYDIYDLAVDAGPITHISVQRDDGETRAFIKFNHEDSVQRCIDNILGIGYGNLIVEANPINIIPTYQENIPNNINTSESEYNYKETYINPYRSRPIPKKKQKKYPTKPRSKNIEKPNKLSSVLV